MTDVLEPIVVELQRGQFRARRDATPTRREPVTEIPQCERCGVVLDAGNMFVGPVFRLLCVSCETTRYTGPSTPPFWAKAITEPNSGCWLWLGAFTPKGYGRYNHRGPIVYPHRLVVELERGEIPEHLEVDHRCRITCCLNPDHLRIVTPVENMRRCVRIKRPQRSHCIRGHEYTEENTIRKTAQDGGCHRSCRTCTRELRHLGNY